MLCKAIKRIPDLDSNWTVQRKYDGIRAIITVLNNEYFIETRTGQDVTHRFPELHPNFTHTPYIIDGEICCFDDYGFTAFQAIQKRTQRDALINDFAAKYPATFVAFDTLSIDALDVMHHPLHERMDYLSHFVTPDGHFIKVPSEQTDQLIPQVCESMGWEGLVYKNLHSPYQAGKRGSDWQKFKFLKHGYYWVVGFTHGMGRRQEYFGALVLADLVAGRYKYRGQVGTGFTDMDLIELTDSFKFTTELENRDYLCLSMTHVSVEPFMVNIEYLESTEAGILRQPAFKGLV
jgi:bifunctional non-homologous end joining protein LigD